MALPNPRGTRVGLGARACLAAPHAWVAAAPCPVGQALATRAWAVPRVSTAGAGTSAGTSDWPQAAKLLLLRSQKAAKRPRPRACTPLKCTPRRSHATTCIPPRLALHALRSSPPRAVRLFRKARRPGVRVAGKSLQPPSQRTTCEVGRAAPHGTPGGGARCPSLEPLQLPTHSACHTPVRPKGRGRAWHRQKLPAQHM